MLPHLPRSGDRSADGALNSAAAIWGSSHRLASKPWRSRRVSALYSVPYAVSRLACCRPWTIVASR